MNINKEELTFITDAGHGWLEVPLTLIKELGIKPSSCSYKNGKYGYLEEDCDLALFDKALRTRGIDTKEVLRGITEVNVDFWIGRDLYERFQ